MDSPTSQPPWWQHLIDLGLGGAVAGVVGIIRDRLRHKRRERLQEDAQDFEHAFKSTELGMVLWERLGEAQSGEIRRLHADLEAALNELRSANDALRRANDQAYSLQLQLSDTEERLSTLEQASACPLCSHPADKEFKNVTDQLKQLGR